MFNRFFWICVTAVLLLPVLAIAAQPVTVVTGTMIAEPEQPQAAVAADGTIHIAFGAGDTVYCSRSLDAGKTFSQPQKIGKLPQLALGLRRGPRIVAGPEAIVVTAISHDRGDLLAWHSADDGQTWKGPARVNDSPNNAREGLHAMAMGPQGEIFCVWLDLRNEGTQLFGAGSTDGGKTWSDNQQIYRSPDGSICECCHPAVTYDPRGNLYVMWRNAIGGNRDLYLAMSHDGGNTFSRASKLGSGSWKLAACPMDGGYLAATASGEVTTVWRRDRQVFRTDSEQASETLLGAGEQPWAVAGPAGVYVVWISKRAGALWLLMPDSGEPKRLATDATDPVIAAPIRGSGPVVVAWQTGRGDEQSIVSRVVER